MAARLDSSACRLSTPASSTYTLHTGLAGSGAGWQQQARHTGRAGAAAASGRLWQAVHSRAAARTCTGAQRHRRTRQPAAVAGWQPPLALPARARCCSRWRRRLLLPLRARRTAVSASGCTTARLRAAAGRGQVPCQGEFPACAVAGATFAAAGGSGGAAVAWWGRPEPHFIHRQRALRPPGHAILLPLLPLLPLLLLALLALLALLPPPRLACIAVCWQRQPLLACRRAALAAAVRGRSGAAFRRSGHQKELCAARLLRLRLRLAVCRRACAGLAAMPRGLPLPAQRSRAAAPPPAR